MSISYTYSTLHTSTSIIITHGNIIELDQPQFKLQKYELSVVGTLLTHTDPQIAEVKIVFYFLLKRTIENHMFVYCNKNILLFGNSK